MKIRDTLEAILRPDPPPAASRSGVLRFQQIASAFLLHKRRTGALPLSAIGLTLDDIAIDCVAPLFERGPKGDFIRLQHYYRGISWKEMAEEELLSYTRRLVFSSVNQGLTTIWKQADPSLEKLLRNLTAAVRKSQRLEIVTHGRHNYVGLVHRSRGQEELEEMSQEYLEVMLSGHAGTRLSMRGVAGAVADILQQQNCYRQEIPLVGLALAVRTVTARWNLPLIEQKPEDSELLGGEIVESIRSSISRIKDRMEPSYVGKGKIDYKTYSTYLDIVNEILVARYAGSNGDGLSLFSCLARRSPGLSREKFRRKHRAVLEYLFKLSEDEFLDSIRTEL